MGILQRQQYTTREYDEDFLPPPSYAAVAPDSKQQAAAAAVFAQWHHLYVVCMGLRAFRVVIARYTHTTHSPPIGITCGRAFFTEFLLSSFCSVVLRSLCPPRGAPHCGIIDSSARVKRGVNVLPVLCSRWVFFSKNHKVVRSLLLQYYAEIYTIQPISVTSGFARWRNSQPAHK